ncbi:hypothetical protein KCU86_g19705, partial [Aureobasidium melanogenum]
MSHSDTIKATPSNLATSASMTEPMNGARHEVASAIFARPNIPPALSMNMYHLNPMQNMFTPFSNASGVYLPQPYFSPSNGTGLKSPPGFTNLPTVSHSGQPYAAQITSPVEIRSDSVTSYLSKGPPVNHHPTVGLIDPTTLDNLPTGATVPVFNENYGPSPSDMPGAEFISWLFEGDQNVVFSPPSQAAFNSASNSQIPFENMHSANGESVSSQVHADSDSSIWLFQSSEMGGMLISQLRERKH